jgi:hypothetical protein
MNITNRLPGSGQLPFYLYCVLSEREIGLGLWQIECGERIVGPKREEMRKTGEN